MKRIIAALLFTVAAATTKADVITDFSGYYDVSNWTQTLDGGTIDLSGAPFSILEISNDDQSGGSSDTSFVIAALEDSVISFDWTYSTSDVDGSAFDPFGFLLNGAFTQLTVDDLFVGQAGSESFAVAAGDIFGFSQRATDSSLGSASTTIFNFSAVGEVPEPTPLFLLSLGLLSLILRRNKTAAE